APTGGIRQLPGGTMSRFSICTLMAFILVSAIGLAALKNANSPWAGMMLLVALAAVGIAVMGAGIMRGRERAWWAGFGFFCSGYLYFAIGPGFSEKFQLDLGTTDLLQEIHSRMAPELPGKTIEEQQAAALAWSRSWGTFQIVGHSLFALLAGLA